MKRFLGIFAALFLVLYVFFPTQAMAEEQKKKGYAEYEYDYGIKLIQYNFWSMAEAHFNNYLKDPKIPADKRARGYLGLAYLFKFRGMNPNATPKAREDAFNKSLENLKEFLAKWPDKDSSEYRAAQVQKYGIEIDRVEATIREINEIEDADKKSAAQDSVRIKLSDAISALRSNHERISEERQNYIDWVYEKADKEGKDPPDYIDWPEDIAQRWVKIGTVLARAYQLYPTIFSSGTSEHKKALQFALTGLEAFVFEHDEDTVYITGGTIQARLYADLIQYERDPAKKEDMKLKVISTFQDYVFYFPSDCFQYLREKAYNELADILISLGDRALFYEEVWPNYLADYPNWIEDTLYGQGYLLAAKIAIAMLENNEASPAVELLTKVIDKATFRSYFTAASFASKQLSTIIEELGPESMDIKTLLQAGRGFKGKGDWANAISYYQYVIQRLDERFDEDFLRSKGFDRKEIALRKEKHALIQREIIDIGSSALSEISECFEAAGMKFEAIVAANKAVSEYFRKMKRATKPIEVEKSLLKASSIAYSLSRSLFYDYMNKDIQSAVIGDLYENALSNRVKIRPNTKGSANYEIGQINNAFGRYLKAVTAYRTVTEAEGKYADAQYNICVCFFKLSSEAKDAGKVEDADKYRVQAIDSLKAVIGMERKWGVSESKKKLSWERKKSQCYILLASIYDAQKMYAELAPLASSWKAAYADKISAQPAYILSAIKVYDRSIKAAIALKDVKKAESVLYPELKKLVLGDFPTEVRTNQKYHVESDIGDLMIPVCEVIAKAISNANLDAERLKYFQLELDKWQGKVKSVIELYKDFKSRSNSPDLQYATGKKLLKAIEGKILSPLNPKACNARYKTLSAKEYLDAIYFPGNAAKTEKMKKKYKAFLAKYLGRKKTRLNYSMASKVWKEIIAMDPDKKQKFWKMKYIGDLSKNLNYQNIRLRVYKGFALDRMLIKLAEASNDKDLAAYASDCLFFLVKYYQKESYKIDCAYASTLAGKYKRARGLYGDLLNRAKKDPPKLAEMRYLTARSYFSHAEALMAEPDQTKEVKDEIKLLLGKAKSQLVFIRTSVASSWDKNPEWAELLKQIVAELEKLK